MQDPIERARTLGRKYTQMLFATFATLFVAWTSWQIIAAVFGVGAAPLATTPAGLASGDCNADLRLRTAAVERAIVASESDADEPSASARYEAALAPDWNDAAGVEARCAATLHGEDALAAVMRFRTAGAELARRKARELGPLRKDLEAYLPPEGIPR